MVLFKLNHDGFESIHAAKDKIDSVMCNLGQVDDDGKIVDAKFKTFGCGSAIASSSLATEWVKGKHLDDAAKIKNSDIAKVIIIMIIRNYKDN